MNNDSEQRRPRPHDGRIVDTEIDCQSTVVSRYPRRLSTEKLTSDRRRSPSSVGISDDTTVVNRFRSEMSAMHNARPICVL